MALQDECDTVKSGWTQRVGSETAQMMAADIATLGPLAAQAVKTGDAFPSIALTDQRGQPFDIFEKAQAQPLVVTFYRGGWCPYCNLELRAYQKVLPDIETLGARLVAVSPETPDNTLATAEKNALTFSVLSDAKGALAEALGIRFRLSEPVEAYFRKAGLDLPSRNGDGGWSLPIPATYVVGRGGHISFAHVEPDYRKRLDPQLILDVLRLDVLRTAGSATT